MTTARKLKTAAARVIGYTVTGHGYDKQHHALTLREALQWAACYPAATVTRRGQFIASKTTGA